MSQGHALTIAGEWIRAAREHPNLAAEIERQAITDDASYLARRSQIDATVVSRLDSLRFRFSCSGDARGAGDTGAVLEHFRGAPPEVLAVPVSRLRLGTRAKTRLIGLGLNTIGQVVNFGTPSLEGVSGAGRKVLQEVYSSFRRVTERFLLSRVILTPPRRLSLEIKRWLGSLEDRTRGIIVARLGLSAPSQTLEVLGVQLKLTRERVRQLEAKAVRNEIEAEVWPQVLTEKLHRVLDEVREPLWLTVLPFYEPFFDDFDYGEQALARVIETFAPDTAHCFSVTGGLLVSRVTEDEWQDLRSTVMDLARDCANRRASYTEFLVAVESLSLSRGARELAPLLIDATWPYVHTAQPQGTTEPVLVAFGRGVDHVVRAVVEEAEVPLHYSEIHRRVLLRAGPDIEVRRVHAALDGEGFYLFARGTYGLWRHLEVSESTSSQIIQAAEEVVARADRQWHAGEILAALRTEAPALVGDLDFYRINAILTRSKELRYLGRMVWVAASSDEKDSSDRIDIAQACTRLLREAGRPLSRVEILDRLKGWRGIGRHFQIHVSEDVFPVEPGVFGLRSRDLRVSMDEVKQMLDCVQAALERRGTGLHVTELASVLQACGVTFASKVSHSTFYAFAARDERLQVDAADYIGLSNWENTKRLSILAAGRQLAEKVLSPISADDFCDKMSSLVGRSLSRTDATWALRDNGYTYDQHSKVWILPADEDASNAGDASGGRLTDEP